MTKHKYTSEQATEAIQSSTSLAQALRKLGILSEGGNYRVIHKLIKKHNLDISHFTGQGWLKGKNHTYTQRPLSDYLSNQYSIRSHSLRLRLLKENIFSHQCMTCKNTEWIDIPIPLELHHVDGNHENNNLENLQLLCPNCHTGTDTYRAKKQKISKGS